MIAVFMRNKHGIDPVRILADHPAVAPFPAAHACIDQQPHLFCPDESRAAASAQAPIQPFTALCSMQRTGQVTVLRSRGNDEVFDWFVHRDAGSDTGV